MGKFALRTILNRFRTASSRYIRMRNWVRRWRCIIDCSYSDRQLPLQYWYGHTTCHEICTRFCCALFCCGYVISPWWIHVTHLPISFRVASLELGQSCDCPTASEATLKDMVEIDHYQTRKIHNKATTEACFCRSISPAKVHSII